MNDLAWAAGLFDGEGCISALRNNGLGGRYLGLHVAVQMCDRKAVRKIARIAGVGNVRLLQPSSPSRRPLWRWKSSSQQAASFLARLVPYLVTKKSQAKLAIELAKEQRKAGRGAALTARRRKFQDSRIRRIKDLKAVS